MTQKKQSRVKDNIMEQIEQNKSLIGDKRVELARSLTGVLLMLTDLERQLQTLLNTDTPFSLATLGSAVRIQSELSALRALIRTILDQQKTLIFISTDWRKILSSDIRYKEFVEAATALEELNGDSPHF